MFTRISLLLALAASATSTISTGTCSWGSKNAVSSVIVQANCNAGDSDSETISLPGKTTVALTMTLKSPVGGSYTNATSFAAKVKVFGTKKISSKNGDGPYHVPKANDEYAGWNRRTTDAANDGASSGYDADNAYESNNDYFDNGGYGADK
ncbi:hypothetical protein SDRG_17415, partial [Saprolegnia diclina VS20]